MLAQEYGKRRDKVDFSKPAFVQSKLDGIRCLAKKGQGRVTLWSRMGKPIETMPHIVSALEGLMEDGETWDGELYIHGVPFQTISSWIKRLQDDSARVQYHVYDAVAEGDFWDRFLPVHERIVNEELVCPDCPTIFAVSAWPVDSHDDLKANHDAYVKDGYEGAMLRHGGCPYEPGRRSPYLVKVKEFMEEEFEVVDVVQGRGKFEGLGILRCVTAEGVTFDATPVGTDLQRRWYFEHRDEVIGKRACIRFFEWTTSDPPVPRFPVAKGLREID
jgi:DNA ligase-1